MGRDEVWVWVEMWQGLLRACEVGPGVSGGVGGEVRGAGVGVEGLPSAKNGGPRGAEGASEAQAVSKGILRTYYVDDANNARPFVVILFVFNNFT